MRNEIKRYVAQWDDPAVQDDARVQYEFRSYGDPRPKLLAIVEHDDGTFECSQSLETYGSSIVSGFLRERAIAVEEGRLLVDNKRLLAEQYLKLWSDMIDAPGPTVRSLASAGLCVEVALVLPESALNFAGKIDPTVGDTMARLSRVPHPTLPGLIQFSGWLHETSTIWAWSEWSQHRYDFKKLPEVLALWQENDFYEFFPPACLQLHRRSTIDLRTLDIFHACEAREDAYPSTDHGITIKHSLQADATSASQMSLLL
jgi:hypothetical protein